MYKFFQQNLSKLNKYNSIFILYILFILLISSLLVPFADDFCHTNNLNSFDRVVYKITNSYMNWNPRFGEYLIFIFYYLGNFSIFKILTSIAITYIPFILFFIVKGKNLNINKKNDIKSYFFISFLVLLSAAQPKETIFWFSGFINYLFSAFLLFLFLSHYRVLINENYHIKESFWKCSFLFVFGLIAGQLSEPGSFVILFIVLILFLYLKFLKRIKLPFWFYTGLIGIFIGLLVLLISPGAQSRMNMEEVEYFKSYTILDKLFQTPQIYLRLLIELPFLSVCTIILLLIQIKKQKLFNFKIKKSLQTYMFLLFFICGCMSANAMIVVAPFFWAGRTFFITSLFFILCILSILEIEKKQNYMKNIISLYIILGIFRLGMMFPEFLRTNYEFNERIRYINKMKKEQVLDLKLKAYTKRFFMGAGDLEKEENDWKNKCFAEFYNLKSVKISN